MQERKSFLHKISIILIWSILNDKRHFFITVQYLRPSFVKISIKNHQINLKLFAKFILKCIAVNYHWVATSIKGNKRGRVRGYNRPPPSRTFDCYISLVWLGVISAVNVIIAIETLSTISIIYASIAWNYKKLN